MPREAGSGWHAQIPDDKAMLRAARDLTKDIADHRADIYWADMIGSALVGYGSLAGAILVDSSLAAIALGVLSVLALYRALLFIHEISHFRNGALPGFRTAWNVFVGVPMLTRPSCTNRFTRCTTSARNTARSRIPNTFRWR